MNLLPFYSDVDLAPMHTVEKTLHKCGPLQGEGSDQEVEPHTAKAVTLQEGHKEAKTNEDHHMHVLETYARQKTPDEIMETKASVLFIYGLL